MDLQVMGEESQVGFDELKLSEVIANGSLDFDGWTSLILEIEKTYPDDIKKICLVYDSFLSEFPLCYGYWRKYADHKAQLCTVDKVIEVFERAVQSATYSVGVWVDYCSFSMSFFEDPCDVHRLFKRGLSFVGKDYLCHTLWDKYIEFEFSQQQWSSLAHIYIQTLRFPTKKLRHYYDSFKKLAAIWEEEMEPQSYSATEEHLEPVLGSEVTTCYTDDEILRVIKDLLDPCIGSFRSKAVQKYLSIGEQLYQEACDLDARIHSFETHIRRPYFHVKPLDASQLENWHRYLDFVEMQGDFDWAVKLYERCLISCANYPEFWMRYVEFMDTKGGREIANFALDRATQVFLKSVPAIHLFNARFKEQIGDLFAARAAFLECDRDSGSNFVENVIKEANMERRLGNSVAASNIYKEALERAAEKQKLHTLPILYVHFSRLKYMITNSADAARDVLIDGIKHVPHCKLLLEELINFAMMHGGPKHINIVDSIVANAISIGPDVSEGFSSKDREGISSLYLEFVDLCGTIHDVKKAWNRHVRLFPHSTRTTTSYKHPATGTKPLEKAIEERRDTLVAMPHHPSRDYSSDHMIQLPIQDQEPSLLENHHLQSNQATTGELQPEATKNSRHGRLQQVSPTVPEQSTEDAPEPNVSTVDSLQQVANDSESLQTSLDNDIQQEHDREIERDVKPLTIERLSLNSQDDKFPDTIPASYEDEAPQATCMPYGNTLESSHDTNENSSISSLISTRSADSSKLLNESMPKSAHNTNGSSPVADSAQMLNGSMLESGNSTNGNHSVSSPLGTLAADSAQIQIELVGLSSSASNENSIATQALAHSQVPANSGGNRRQINNFNRPRRDSSYDKRHRQQQVSRQQKYPRAEMGAQTLRSQGCPSQLLSKQNPQVQQSSQAQNHYQAAATSGSVTTTHAGPMQNVQQQNTASPSQSPLPAQPVSYPQEQMSQYPMQSIDQSGHMQSSHAYNQMWQYYYQQQYFLQQQHYHQEQQLHLQQHFQQQPQQQQQQLLQQYQQQQLQLQQNYLEQQQQQQQPYQQQQQFLPQLQQPNQQQQLQLQQQQQLLYLQQQQQQLQQLQHQQYLQSQQQQEQQQQPQLHQSQPQQQQPEQQQQHQSQSEQQQLQQQQEPPQQQHLLPPQQQQQHQLPSQQQQQEEQEQEQHEQQTTPSQTRSWNSDLYQQGQGLMPCHSTPASRLAVSPHPQQQSPQNQ